MRQFLYISPYFPPVSRVGALRPLKLLRHLQQHGWQAVVLCDQVPGDAVSPELERAIPASVQVVRDYSWFASRPGWRAGAERWTGSHSPKPQASASSKGSGNGGQGDIFRWISWNPEWIPLGRHFVDMPYALQSVRRLGKSYAFDAIVVNADPWASLLVGSRASNEIGVPWIADLRDPWGPCALRRPLRPKLQQNYVHRTELQLIRSSSAYVLNTDRAREDYIAAYPEVPISRFHTLRNHSDPELTSGGQPLAFPEFTLLFLGGFRRFVASSSLLKALRVVKGRSTSPFKLRIYGSLPQQERAEVQALGLQDVVVVERPRPYTEVGMLLSAADLVVSQSHSTDQRIPAKVYDYLSSNRPMLHIGAENQELSSMFEQAGQVDFVSSGDVDAIAAVVERHIAAGRQRSVVRNSEQFTSRAAARKFAALLDAAVDVAVDVAVDGAPH